MTSVGWTAEHLHRDGARHRADQVTAAGSSAWSRSWYCCCSRSTR